MPFTESARNEMLEAIKPDKVSLHNGDPGENGANELEGGEYARQSIEWNAASEGAMDDKSNGIAFSVPAGSKVKFVGFWKEEELKATDEVTEESFTNAGTYTLTDADLSLT